jgi:hypothetical protein
MTVLVNFDRFALATASKWVFEGGWWKWGSVNFYSSYKKFYLYKKNRNNSGVLRHSFCQAWHRLILFL